MGHTGAKNLDNFEKIGSEELENIQNFGSEKLDNFESMGPEELDNFEKFVSGKLEKIENFGPEKLVTIGADMLPVMENKMKHCWSKTFCIFLPIMVLLAVFRCLLWT